MTIESSFIAIFVFVLAYILFIFFPHKRTAIAMLAGLVLILFRVITLKNAFFAVNWNVMGIFVGTLIVADIFMESRVPAFIAELIVDRAKNTAWSILLICALTGFISALLNNVDNMFVGIIKVEVLYFFHDFR